MIEESIVEHKVAETDNLLYTEVVQHTLFCKRRVQVVYGRKQTLKVMAPCPFNHSGLMSWAGTMNVEVHWFKTWEGA